MANDTTAAGISAKDGAPDAAATAAGSSAIGRSTMRKLVLELVRPYHGWLAIVFIAMLVETAMSMAGP